MDTLNESREELRLFATWDVEGSRARRRDAAVASLVVHAVGVLALFAAPAWMWSPPLLREAPRQVVTPLVAPPAELTQRSPNTGKIAKTFDAKSLRPRPPLRAPPSPPSTTRPAAREPAPIPSLPEPPQVQIAENRLPTIAPPVLPPPAPEKPR
ncbi:MAG: hypothetical protein ACRD96_09505, partial [Bryobacteraceae bacterium]